MRLLNSPAGIYAYALNDAGPGPSPEHDMALCVTCGRRMDEIKNGPFDFECWDCRHGLTKENE